MNEIFRLMILNADHSRLLRRIVNLAVATIFIVCVTAYGIAGADNQQYAVVARFDAKSAGLTDQIWDQAKFFPFWRF